MIIKLNDMNRIEFYTLNPFEYGFLFFGSHATSTFYFGMCGLCVRLY